MSVARPDGLDRRHLFGLDFVDAPDNERVIDALLAEPRAALPAGCLPVVVTPNVDHLVRLDRGDDPVANSVAAAAAIVLPDGQPIVWSSRWFGAPLTARLPGSALVAELWPRLIELDRRCLVVATTQQIAAGAAAGGTTIDTIVAPRLDLADRPAFEEFIDRCHEMVARLHPEFVFVTLGFPKQCNVIAGLIERGRDGSATPPWFLAVGASFEMMFGDVRRAPAWMQRIGMEWCYRFLREPRRLFRRYFIDDVAFIGLLRRERRRRHRAA